MSNLATVLFLCLVIPAASAGLNGVIFALTATAVEAGFERETAMAASILFLWLVNTSLFWRWRIAPALRSGEFKSWVEAIAGTLLVSIMLFAVSFFLGAAVLYGSDEDISAASRPWVVLAMGLAGIHVAMQTLRQAAWFHRTYRSVENFPTSKLRSAAAGPVEVCGEVIAGDAALPLVVPTENGFSLKPFDLNDGTGSINVLVPDSTDVGNEDELIWLPYYEGRPRLVPGDRVRVLGHYDVTRVPPVLCAWHPPVPSAFFSGLLGKARVFVIAMDDERAIRDELSAKAAAWIGFSIAWLVGAVIFTGLAWTYW